MPDTGNARHPEPHGTPPGTPHRRPRSTAGHRLPRSLRLAALPVAAVGALLLTALPAQTAQAGAPAPATPTAPSGETDTGSRPAEPTPRAALPIRGGDLSSLPKNEDNGAVYRTADGTETDPVALLASSGVNYARLKVWVDPADGYNDQAHVLEMAQRASEQGIKLLIDFHYSDFWADPGQQNKPASWADHDYDQLRQDVADHTTEVLSALEDQGTPADMVQIGNEINSGMLLPEGSIDDWDQLAGLLTAGAEAAKAVSSSTQVALHLAEGGDLEGTQWWFDQAVSRNVPFDVVALSYYGYWHGTIADLKANLTNAAKRYGKPVLVAETSYAHTLENDDQHENVIGAESDLQDGYPATPEGQAANLRDVMDAVASVPNGLGLGVVYWEPAWTAREGSGWDPTDPSAGNAWENQALFDYDDRALPALEEFNGG